MVTASNNTEKEFEKEFVKTSTSITPEKRRELIAEAAFQLAKQRGFRGDCQLQDWLEAEKKIEHMYGKGE